MGPVYLCLCLCLLPNCFWIEFVNKIQMLNGTFNLHRRAHARFPSENTMISTAIHARSKHNNSFSRCHFDCIGIYSKCAMVAVTKKPNMVYTKFTKSPFELILWLFGAFVLSDMCDPKLNRNERNQYTSTYKTDESEKESEGEWKKVKSTLSKTPMGMAIEFPFPFDCVVCVVRQSAPLLAG